MGKPLFECSVCSRCGGSGHYSYNMMHGSRCYGCSGSGWKLSKRGAAAQKYLNELRSVKISDLKVGDFMLYELIGSASFSEVLEVIVGVGSDFGYPEGSAAVSPMIRVNCVKGSLIASADSKVRKGFSVEKKEEQRQAALLYQSRLNKDGSLGKKFQQEFANV